MGFRPTIMCDGMSIELGKLYSYVDSKKLESVKWLIEHNKLDEYSDDPEELYDAWYWLQECYIIFKPSEYREFMDIYMKDAKAFQNEVSKHGGNPLNNTDTDIFKAIYESNKPKAIEWG